MECNFLLLHHLFKQRKTIFDIYVNRNGKKLTVSRKNAKIFTVNLKATIPLRPSDELRWNGPVGPTRLYLNLI